MQVDFNLFNAQQRDHEEMMIRQLEDDGDGDGDDDDDEDVNTKKHMLLPKIAKKKKIQSKIVKIPILTRHRKPPTNSDRKNGS